MKLGLNELIEKLTEIAAKEGNIDVEVSTGHSDRGGRFYGELYRATVVEDYKGKRVRLTGRLEESEEE